MSSALSAALQGLERGAGIGLNIYTTLEESARAKRQESLQRERYARQDMESDRTYERQVGRDQVADNQWETNLQFMRDQHADAQEIRKGQLGVSQRQVGVSEGQLGLANNQFQYRKDEDTRVREETSALNAFRASLFDDKGAYIDDPRAFADKVNNDPQAMRAMVRTAVAQGMIDPERAEGYSGMQLVPTEKGFALRVAGKDGTGQPIRAGGAPLTENGTSDPNDPVVHINLNQLRQMADPNFREAQRSSALHQDQVSAVNDTLTAQESATSGAFAEDAARAEQEVTALSEGIKLLEQQRAELPAKRYTASGREYANPDVAKTERQLKKERELLEKKQGALSNILSQAQSVPGVYQQRRDQAVGRLDGNFQLAGESYRANTLADVRTAQAKMPELQRQADTAFKGMVDTVISRMAKPRAGEPPNKVSPAEMQSLMYMLPVEQQRQIATDPQYKALFFGTAEFMQRTGFKGNPTFLMEAQAAGANLDTYSEYVQAPQNAGRAPEEVHREAMEVGKESAANPGRSLGAIAGSRFLP